MSKKQYKYQVYIASALFCKESNDELDIIERSLDELGLTYFSPRRDSKLDMSGAKTLEEKNSIAQQIFDLNESAIKESRLVLANTEATRYRNSLYGDCGTMIEIGLSIAWNTPLVAFNFYNYGLNIMMSQKVISNISDLSLKHGDSPNNTSKLEILQTIITQLEDGYSIKNLRDIHFKLINELV